VGSTFEWMAFRRHGKPSVAHKLRWAGERPAPAFELELVSNDVRYRFVIPKACGNLALADHRPVPTLEGEAGSRQAPDASAASAAGPMAAEPTAQPPPSPRCRLRLTPSRGCTDQPVVIDASGTDLASDQLRRVWLSQLGPTGVPRSLGEPDAGTELIWTRRFAHPGVYRITLVATALDGTRLRPYTASFEALACLPDCGLAVTDTEVYTNQSFSVDAGVSEARVGKLDKVEVTALAPDNERLLVFAMEPPFRDEVALARAGEYRLRATCVDTTGQQAADPSPPAMRVIPRLGLFVDFLVGGEDRPRDETDVGVIGLGGGASYMVSDRFELAGTAGVGVDLGDAGDSKLYLGVEGNLVEPRFFLGAGFGVWDLTRFERRAGTVNIHGGIDLMRHGLDRPLQLYVEARTMLDSDSQESDFVIWGGLRYYPRGNRKSTTP
jgi:hypothetical protein